MTDRDGEGLAPAASETAASEAVPPGSVPPEDDCPLPAALQRRNILLYGALWGLYYLAAPITYVGITHANLIGEFGEDDALANLPSSMYLWTAALPVIVALLFPQPKLAKPILISCLGGMAFYSGCVAAALWFDVPNEVRIRMVIVHGLVLGIGSGLSYPAQWEILRRGVSSSRRGAVMALAFGVGPVLACIGSLGQQLILSGTAHGWSVDRLPFPGNYALLFGLGAPVMVVTALCASLFIVPPGKEPEPGAERAREMVQGVRDFISRRPIWLGVICYVLVYAGGNSIMQTVSLDAPRKIAAVEGNAPRESESARESESQKPESKSGSAAAAQKTKAAQGTVGYQNELRFGFKAVAGLLLGWLLARTNPKAALLATTSTLLVALCWALLVTGEPYLIAIGLLGAGELFGAYYPNYVVSASPRHRVRLNMAYLTLMGSIVGFAPILFGMIADRHGRETSIQVAAAILIATMLIVVVALPKDPRPPEPVATAV